MSIFEVDRQPEKGRIMNFADIFGLTGGILTSVGFIPQIIKSWKTKKIDDVALWQPVILTIGMSLWLAYGLIGHKMPVIVSNAFAISCNIVILWMKFAYRGNG